MASFHDVRFPTDIALGAKGGPERLTEIVTLGSGAERRNQRWAHARRRWDAGFGVRSLQRLAEVVAFFEERRGRLHGFRWRDRLDFSSAPPGGTPAATDQAIGAGDGRTTAFALLKRYGAGADAYHRPITKPVAGSVLVAVDGAAVPFTLDALTGVVTLETPAPLGKAVTAGFLFDVPVRFDTDSLDVDLTGFSAGVIPSIPVIEIIA